MALDLIHEIDVANDLEIKTLRIAYAGLPKAAAFVVFLGVERGMMQILEQELRLLIEGLLNCFRRFEIVPEKMLREADDHFTARLLFVSFCPA
jgi:hypothetical protein